MKAQNYCRLQQTCRGVGEFIRRSPNISVHFGGYFMPIWNKERSRYEIRSFQYRGAFPIRYRGAEPIDSFYGTKLHAIDPGQLFFSSLFSFTILLFPYYVKITATDVNVENFCDALKKYRITCKELFLSDIKWKRKKCAMLINI